MARKSDIYRSPPVDAALAGGIGESDGRRSRRMAHICGRYLEILRRAGPLSFSPAERDLLGEVLPRIPSEQASAFRGLWHRVQDALDTGDVAKRSEVDGPDLIARLQELSYVQEVALIELLETQAAQNGKGATTAS